jgi:transposase InsO family protein
MKITMNTARITSISDVEDFLQGAEKVSFFLYCKKDKYRFVSSALVKLKYGVAKKKDKTLIKKYLIKVTGYSRIQLKRLIKKWDDGKLLSDLDQSNRHRFPRLYGPIEIALLVKADIALNFPNGNAVKNSLIREYEVFKKKDYDVISKISVSHIYNVRNKSLQYQSKTKHYTKTNPVSTPIGERRKPQPDGKPGYLRIDSVHQGDLEGVKGVYHVNVVDEVTQWEVVGCVKVISERYLIPLLEDLINQFPFTILNFHSDNGSEYINYQVQSMLNRLIIKQTKSRSRKTNDQALVEGKNGSVIRKHIGRNHIPKKYADPINIFYQKYFNPFLNYHRICSFATNYTDKRGKIKKKYNIHLTPYAKLKSLKNAEQYLKEGITFEILDEIAYAKSDIEAGEKVRKEKSKVFKTIKIN